MTRHLCAFMRRQFVRRSKFEPAAVYIKHHRTAAAQARCPDVQLQHVLALPAIIPILQKRLLFACPVMQMLRAVSSVYQGRVFVFPRHWRLWRKKAIFAAGVLSERNSLECENIAIQVAPHRAVLRLRDGAARRAASSRLLVCSRFDAV